MFREGTVQPSVDVMTSRQGTTLVELLVVFGLIAVLIAILLPALRSVRTMAQHTVCASRLRDLAVASEMYRQDHGRYPEPCRYTPATDTPPNGNGKVLPHQVQRRLLNDVQPYLMFPQIDPDTPAARLPHHVQSPAAAKVSMGRGPRRNHPAEPEHYYTGFIYAARLEEASVVAGGTNAIPIAELPQDAALLLKPEQSATAKGRRRAVVWADDLNFSSGNGGIWRYIHTRGGGDGAMPFAHQDAGLLQGQHRAYTDGSVEWISAGHLMLELPDATLLNGGANPTTGGATYRVDQAYWWF